MEKLHTKESKIITRNKENIKEYQIKIAKLKSNVVYFESKIKLEKFEIAILENMQEERRKKKEEMRGEG